jgi:hypothetical protein
MLSPSTKYFVFPDSGLLLVPNDVKTFAGAYKTTADTSFESRNDIMPKGCPYLNDDNNVYKCFFPQYFAYNIKSNLFIVNSIYDSYTLKDNYGLNCVTETDMSDCGADDKVVIE